MLAWLLCIIVLFFPESGLVLFMSFYHWVCETKLLGTFHNSISIELFYLQNLQFKSLESSFGKAEFIFWIIRGVINASSLTSFFKFPECFFWFSLFTL